MKAVQGQKEVKINDYITLKLENKETIINVAGKRLYQCKVLLLNIPRDKRETFNEIDSIDEAAEKLDQLLERDYNDFTKLATPEGVFWGHCSNIQAWAENDYDFRLLHRNLAFPLLKKLTEVGDPLAKKVFKDEVARRFVNGNTNVRLFLLSGKYLKSFELEEKNSLLESMNLEEFSKSNPKLSLELLDNLIANNFLNITGILKSEIERWMLDYNDEALVRYLFSEGFLDYFNDHEMKDLFLECIFKGKTRIIRFIYSGARDSIEHFDIFNIETLKSCVDVLKNILEEDKYPDTREFISEWMQKIVMEIITRAFKDYKVNVSFSCEKDTSRIRYDGNVISLSISRNEPCPIKFFEEIYGLENLKYLKEIRFLHFEN